MTIKKSLFKSIWNALLRELRWIVRVILSALERFYWGDGFSKSASLAYTSLFSLVPFVTLAFGIFAAFALSDEYVASVEQFIITKFVPAGNVASQINDFLQHVRSNISDFSLPIIIFFVVSSILLINTIEYALNEIWQVFEPRSWSHRIGVFSSIILIAPLLIISVYVLTSLRLEPFLVRIGAESLHPVLHPLYSYIFPFLLLVFAFAGLYYMIPKTVVKLRPVIFGSLFTSIIFVSAYWGFALYIEHNASYEKLYGAIAAIPIFLFWLYVFWTIVLLGAEVTYQAQYLPRSGKTWKRSVYSVGEGQIVLAMQSLIMIVQAFIKGEKIPDYIQIAETLGCSSVMLRPALEKLARAGIISAAGLEEKKFTLLRSPDKIYLVEIRNILSGENSKYAAELSAMFTAYADNATGVSLMDIVQQQNEEIMKK